MFFAKKQHFWQIFWHFFSIFFDVALFLLSSLVTGSSFMSISSLVLELWKFSFIRDWTEIRKLEIPPSEFCPISADLVKLGIPNLAWMFLIKCYWMLQNARITAFTVSELLRENRRREGGGGALKLPPTQIQGFWIVTSFSTLFPRVSTLYDSFDDNEGLFRGQHYWKDKRPWGITWQAVFNSKRK